MPELGKTGLCGRRIDRIWSIGNVPPGSGQAVAPNQVRLPRANSGDRDTEDGKGSLGRITAVATVFAALALLLLTGFGAPVATEQASGGGALFHVEPFAIPTTTITPVGLSGSSLATYSITTSSWSSGSTTVAAGDTVVVYAPTSGYLGDSLLMPAEIA